MFLVSLFPVKVSADNGKLTAEQALRILQSVNPNIAKYDIETHLVTFKDGSKPVYVTPPGALTQNGEVTWDYFIEQKGDIRGWFKLPLDKIIAEKKRMLKESGLSISSTTSTTSNYAYVNLTQYPQQGITFCGPAATQSVLSGWGKNISQSDIIQKEYSYDGHSVPPQCPSDYWNYPGVSENAIAYALNGYIFNQWTSSYWYKISHFYSVQDFINIVQVDIGGNQAGVIFCGDTKYLPAWNGHSTIHYTALYGYNINSSNQSYSTVWYTDSANGLYKYCGIVQSGDGKVNYQNLPAYNSCYLNASSGNSYYQYSYSYPAVG
jgi:hypothetical protein